MAFAGSTMRVLDDWSLDAVISNCANRGSAARKC
jgi:hypothetical protein